MGSDAVSCHSCDCANAFRDTLTHVVKCSWEVSEVMVVPAGDC